MLQRRVEQMDMIKKQKETPPIHSNTYTCIATRVSHLELVLHQLESKGFTTPLLETYQDIFNEWKEIQQTYPQLKDYLTLLCTNLNVKKIIQISSTTKIQEIGRNLQRLEQVHHVLNESILQGTY